MRPSKSIKYCRDCGFRKIQFETEEKALNFIRFNASDIKKESGYAPVRAYFCESCGCYHLTSKRKLPFNVKSRTQRILEAFNRNIRKKESLSYSKRELRITYVQDEELHLLAAKNIQQINDKKEFNRQREKIRLINKLLKLIILAKESGSLTLSN